MVFRGKYSFLSNFYPVKIEYEGIVYPSVEHAYQAAKVLDVNLRLLISRLNSPSRARQMGRSFQVRHNWDNIKLSIMENLLRIKFSLPYLRNRLIATKGIELIEENWWNDTFWGVSNGVGENNLGRILMKLRDEFINAKKKK